MIEYMLVSDSGAAGPKVTAINSIYYDEDYIHHFDIRIFGKEVYEYYRTPRKLNSYALQLGTGDSVPLGILCIVTTQLADFNWFSLDFNYGTIGVPGIAMPVGALDAKVFYRD